MGKRILRRHPFSSDFGRSQVDAADPHRQFDRVDRNVGLIAVGFGQLDGSLLQTAIPERQSTGLPPQGFDAIASSIDEQKQRTAGDALAELGGDDSGQSIEAFAEVDRRGAQEDRCSLR